MVAEMKVNDTWERRQATIKAARERLAADEKRRARKDEQRRLDKINARKRGWRV